ncbi:hypothetical protein HZ994_13735 [Akkermansiaceae bacterium]|nr:hypothetical protein HZ994_13735 [Akkermansiaceae bacterium]
MVSTKQAPAEKQPGNLAIPSLSPLIGWIDRELADTFGTAHGRGGDTLLKLRREFSRNCLNSAIGGFYRLLPRLERNHFLLSYRIRRWISLNYEITVSDPLERVPAERLSIRQGDRALADHRGDFAQRGIAAADVRMQVVVR